MDSKVVYLNNKAAVSGPIFHQPWWLDVVCQKGSWDVCVATDEQNNIIGMLPYYLTSVLGFKIIRTPPFTPYLGVWLDYSHCSERYVSIYSFENEIIGKLIDQLPNIAWYHQIHPEQLTNWLPFYWNSFRQTTRYTFVYEQLNIDIIWEQMKDKTRNVIRKAKTVGLSISPENNLDKFLQLLNKTFDRQRVNGSSNLDIFRQLHEAIQQQKQGTIYFVKDKEGYECAALYLIWDQQTAYCWQLGVDTERSKNGAVQFLIWHSIQEASKIVKRYNFEGSMLPHIEPVFRAFGAERKPVHRIWKGKGVIGKLIECLHFRY